MMSAYFPWQQSQWQQLQTSRQQARLPHAVLLTGPQGLGKNHFALLFAQSLLCQTNNADGIPCDECRYCQLFQANNHPDIRLLGPRDGKKGIGVDQVREIGQFMELKSQYIGYKVVIINPAEMMNINASNSLLKTLEEPSAETLLLLVTHQPARLPATIRSRCQEIRFGISDSSIGRTWLAGQVDESVPLELLLALADNAPLKALELADQERLQQRQALFDDLEQLVNMQLDPTLLASRCCKTDAPESLRILSSWIMDMVRFRSTEQPPHTNNPDLHSRLLKLANQVSLGTLFQLQDRMTDARQEFERNLNPTLIMESVLIQWQQVFRTNRKLLKDKTA